MHPFDGTEGPTPVYAREHHSILLHTLEHHIRGEWRGHRDGMGGACLVQRLLKEGESEFGTSCSGEGQATGGGSRGGSDRPHTQPPPRAGESKQAPHRSSTSQAFASFPFVRFASYYWKARHLFPIRSPTNGPSPPCLLRTRAGWRGTRVGRRCAAVVPSSACWPGPEPPADPTPRDATRGSDMSTTHDTRHGKSVRQMLYKTHRQRPSQHERERA